MKKFVTTVASPVGAFAIEGDEEFVSALYLPHEGRRASRGTPPRPVRDAAAQLGEYLAGRRRRFDLALAPAKGTDFQRAVWSTLDAIAYGEVLTYAEVADAAGHPGAQRAVGNANHANPLPVFVPCHRVVAASGLGGYGGGEHVKRFLLTLEGVTL